MFFGLEKLNRVSFLRQDSNFLQCAFKDKSSIFIPFVEGNGFMDSRDFRLVTMDWSHAHWRKVLGKIEPVMDKIDGRVAKSGFLLTFLGLYPDENGFKFKEYSGRPVFAIDFKTSLNTLIERKDIEFISNQFTVLDRSHVFNLTNESASLFSHGKMYLDWLGKYHYCPGCGSEMYPIHGGTKLQCGNTDPTANCDVRDAKVTNVCFPRTDPVVIVAIVNRSYTKICLGRSRRKHGDFVMYSTIAGFMEPAETVEHCCQREVWEETGVKVETENVDILLTQPWPYPANLMIGCLAVVDFNGINENINLGHDEELLHAQWFDVEQIAEAFDKHDPTSNDLVKLDDTIRIPGKTAIAHQLIKKVVAKSKRLEVNL